MDEKTFDEVSRDLRENESYFKNHALRFRLTIGLAPAAEPGRTSRILDIGCWPGYLSLYFKRLGWEVDAIDLKPDRIPKVSEAGIRVISHNLNEIPKLPFPENHFDIILFTEVFEHLNPASFPELFAGIGQCLRPGGRLILTTPNRLALNKDLFNPNRWSEPEVDEEGHGHWKEYRLSEVVGCFESSDLEIVHRKTVSFYSHLGRSNDSGYFPLADWRKHSNKLRNFAKVLVKPLRSIPLFRDSLIVVAQKPDEEGHLAEA